MAKRGSKAKVSKALRLRRSARRSYERAAAKHPPGGKGGYRFKAVARSAERGGAVSGEAVAAMVGRKKYGSQEFARMGAAGRRRKGRGKR